MKLKQVIRQEDDNHDQCGSVVHIGCVWQGGAVVGHMASAPTSYLAIVV